MEETTLEQRLTSALNSAVRDQSAPYATHDQHTYDAGCYVCRGDVPKLVEALLPVVRSAVDEQHAKRIVSAIWGSREESSPRPFGLYRHEDVTGASGTGLVATGAQFDDGTVVVRWRGESPSTVVWPSIEAAEKVHGHNGKTHVVWLAEPIAELCAAIERDMVAARLPGDALSRLRDAMLAANGEPWPHPQLVPFDRFAEAALSETQRMLIDGQAVAGND